MTQRAPILDTATVKRFIEAGNARFTVVNPATGNRFTFKVRTPEDNNGLRFVSVLTGSDNEGDYTYLGTVFPDGNFRVTRKSRISPDAPSAKAFAWLWKRLQTGGDLAPAQVWHEGTCGRCNRALTVPSSIAMGIGPECAAKMGIEV